MRHLLTIGMFLLPIFGFTQSVNFTRLNGPVGGFIETERINPQGDIIASDVGSMNSFISRDGGNTWSSVSGNIGSLGLTAHPDGSFYGFGFSAPNINRISLGTNFVQNIPIGDLNTNNYDNFAIDKEGVFFKISSSEEFLRSDDNGVTWASLGDVPFKGVSFYFLSMHTPKDSDYVYLDLWDFFANSNKLFRIKKDGTATEEVWNSEAIEIDDFCHDPGQGHFFTRGGEVYHSVDGSFNSWVSISSGFDAQFLICGPNSELTVAGADGYYRTNDLGVTWTPIDGLKPTTHPNGFYGVYNEVYNRYIIENLSSSTFNLFSVSADFTDWQPINPDNTTPAISRVFVDSDENIYAGVQRANESVANGFHRSEDGGGTFQPFLLPNGVEVISVSEGADNTIFALGFDDNLYRSTDYGDTWILANPPVFIGPLSGLNYSFVEGHKNGTIVASFAKGSIKLWVSYDNGLTWEPIDNAQHFRNWLAIHPNGDIYSSSLTQATVLRKYSKATRAWSTVFSNGGSVVPVEVSPEGVIIAGATYRGLPGMIISEDNGESFAGTSFSLNNLKAGPNGTLLGTIQADGRIYMSRNNGLSWEVAYHYGAPFGGPGEIREFFFDKNNRINFCVTGNYIHRSAPFIFNDNYIVGNIIYDLDEECDVDASEPPLPNILVTATGLDTFHVTTAGNGRFVIPVPDGTYDVSISVDEDYWIPCDSFQTVSVAGINDSVFINFPVKSNVKCPLMQVDLTNDFLRRCFDNTYHVRYCNEGTVTAQNASVDVTLDPRMSIISSTIPVTNVVGDTYTFALPDVPISTCERFSFVTDMICDEVELGETLCAEARVFPDTICITPDPTWNGASLAIEGECINDTIFFEVRNVGSGNMLESKEYIIIEDIAVNRVSPPIMLNAGIARLDTIPSNGQTFHIEVEQVSNHPGNSKPRLTVEKCGTPPFTYGLFNQFGQDDLSGMLDIECREAIGSYDPNDKSAVPEGIGQRHITPPNSTLEYMVRFQNTGTDTAFNVVIMDTISNLLNLSSLEVGASSHDYNYKIIENGILRFDFPNIMLPDSNTNLAGSNGFVKFKFTLKPDVPLGSTVYNAADIYFDYNDPIYTNQTFHLIDTLSVLVKTIDIFDEHIEVNVFPNPFNERATFGLKNSSNNKKKFVLYTINGQVLRNQNFEGQRLEIERGNLPKGIYFYEILEENRKIVAGKIVVQ